MVDRKYKDKNKEQCVFPERLISATFVVEGNNASINNHHAVGLSNIWWGDEGRLVSAFAVGES